MGKKKTLMTWEAARRIQSVVDSGRARKADAGFKARAMRAAARNFSSKIPEEIEITLFSF